MPLHGQQWEKRVKLANKSGLLSSPLRFLPLSSHPSLSSVWLTSDAVVSFFPISALHHPLPLFYPMGVVLVLCVEKWGEGEVSQWCNFLYKINLSSDFKGGGKQKSEIKCRCKVSKIKKGWCKNTGTNCIPTSPTLIWIAAFANHPQLCFWPLCFNSERIISLTTQQTHDSLWNGKVNVHKNFYESSEMLLTSVFYQTSFAL